MSKEFLKYEKLYSKLIRHCFSDLLNDKIIDTRIKLAKICSKFLNLDSAGNIKYLHKIIFLDFHYFTKDQKFLKICKQLTNDPKSSVRQFFRNQSQLESVKIDEDIECIDPGLLFNHPVDYLIKEFSINLIKYTIKPPVDLVNNLESINDGEIDLDLSSHSESSNLIEEVNTSVNSEK